MQRLQAMTRRGGFPGGKPPPGAYGVGAGLLLLLGGGLFLNNAIFNVDGGQRAIKYRRISGVSKDIYNEGESGCAGNGAPSLQANYR